MTQIPTVGMQINKTQAIRALREIRQEYVTLKKTFAGGLVPRGSKDPFTQQAKGMQGFRLQMFELTKATQLIAGPLSGFAARITALSSLLTGVGAGVGAFVATLALLGYALYKSIRLAADFEMGLIGVAKASNLSVAGLKRMTQGILSLSSELALPSGELLTIAENAARLGIDGSENILKFTKTIGMITRATDLTAESASTAFARILKVTNTSVDEVDKLASVIVQLGNNVAATESEITDVALTIARASGVFGIGAADSATLGAAFAQFGVQAEVAGSTVGRVMGTIKGALDTGSLAAKNLEVIMGRSISDIKVMFETDALGALSAFIGGVGEMEKQGLDAVQVLRQFGLEGIREAKALLPLIDNVDELARVLTLSKEEYKDNTALLIEYGRYADAANVIFGGFAENIKNIATAIGLRLLPKVKNLGKWLQDGTKDVEGITKAITNWAIGLFTTFKVLFYNLMYLPAMVVLAVKGALDWLTHLTSRLGDVTTAIKEFAKGNAFEIPERAEPTTLEDMVAWNAKRMAANKDLADLLAGKDLTGGNGKDDPNEFLRQANEELEETKTKLTESGDATAFLTKEVEALVREFAKGNVVLSEGFLGIRDLKIQQELLSTADALSEVGDVSMQGLVLEMEKAGVIGEDLAKNFKELEGTRLKKAVAGALVEWRNLVSTTEAYAQEVEQILSGALKGAANSFGIALEDLFKGEVGLSGFFDTFLKGVKDSILGGIAQAMSLSASRNLFAPLSALVLTPFMGKTGAGAIAEDTFGLARGSLDTGLFADLADGLDDAVGALDKFAFETFGIGRGIYKVQSGLTQGSGEMYQTLTPLLGNLEEVVGGVSTKLKDFGQNAAIGFGISGNAAGALAGGVLGTLGKKLGEKLGKAIGGTLGQALGPLGGLLGSVAGGLIGSLFSKTPRSQVALSGAGVGGVYTRGSGNAATGESLGGSVLESLSSISDALGGFLTDKAFGSIGQRGDEFFFDPRQGLSNPRDLGDPEQYRYATAEEAVRAALRSALEQGVIEGLSDTVSYVLDNAPITQSLESLLEDLQFAQTFDEAFGTLELGLTSFEKEILALNDSFDKAAKTAERLGLAEGRVEQARQVALLDKRIDFNREVQLDLLDIVDPLQGALARLEDEYKERLANAQAIGGNINAVEALYAQQRQGIIEQFAQQTNGVLRQYLLELTATTSSPLAPELAVSNASRNFADLRERFFSGETGVASDLVTAGQNLLGLRRELDASGPGYFDAVNYVQGVVEEAIAFQGSTSDPQTQLLEDIAFSNQEAIDQRNRMIELLEQSIAEGVGTGGDASSPALTSSGGSTNQSGLGTISLGGFTKALNF